MFGSPPGIDDEGLAGATRRILLADVDHSSRKGGVLLLETFYIYHTNDIHSHFLHWPKLTAYLKDTRHRHEMRGEAMLQFDIGDHLDRFHPMTEGTSGRGNIRLLNEAGYDAVTIGNNEGVTLSGADLEHLYDQAQFPVLTANLFTSGGERPKAMQPYEIFTLNNGLTVAAVGITIPFSAFYEPLGWDIVHPLDMLADLIREVREQADIVVLLSHMGLSFDKQIAREFEGIDVILGAHTHHLLRQGTDVDGTPITQCGKYGRYVGRITLTYDTEQRQVVGCEANCLSIERYREDAATVNLLEQLTADGIARLKTPVAELKESLTVSWFEPSPFARLLAEALNEWCAADVAMVNAGILLDSLPEGGVTKEDLHRICPHPINPCKLTLTGAELREVIRHCHTDDFRRLEIKGLGFRGKMLGEMVFDGICVSADNDRIKSIDVHGAPLDPDGEYDVAMLDMYTFGKIFPGFAEKEKQYFVPEMLRDVLAWKLAGDHPVSH